MWDNLKEGGTPIKEETLEDTSSVNVQKEEVKTWIVEMKGSVAPHLFFKTTWNQISLFDKKFLNLMNAPCFRTNLITKRLRKNIENR